MTPTFLVFALLVSLVSVRSSHVRQASLSPFLNGRPQDPLFPTYRIPKEDSVIPKEVFDMILESLRTPSPSPTPSPYPSPQTAKALTATVGKFLGRIGSETLEFRRLCKKCCRKTKNKLRSVFPVLNGCGRCRLKKSLDPPKNGRCGFDARLGFAKTPTKCFYERCHTMLIAKGSCMCLAQV